jgi:hypothetical protein
MTLGGRDNLKYPDKNIRLCILLTFLTLPMGIALIVVSAHGPAGAAYLACLLAPSIFLSRVGVNIPIIGRFTMIGSLLLVGVQFLYCYAVLTLIGKANLYFRHNPPR